MKKIYIKKLNKQKRNIVVAISLSVLILCLLFFFSDRITNVSLKISAPFQAVSGSVGSSVSDWLTSIMKKGELKRERDLLLNEKEKLTAEIVRLREVERENENLRKALGLGMDKDFRMVMANVVGRSILDDAILIDKGLKDGIEEGLPVVTESRVTVGTIGKVFNDFSRVVLVTCKESAFEAEIQGKNIIGLVEGGGGSEMRMSLIPKEIEVAEGDVLVTAPLSSVFPQGLFVGLVKKIEKRDGESFQSAKITPYFNARRLDRVFVITDRIIDYEMD